MHGIGDNLHQRAVMRILRETHNVTLESSWHSLYHDLIGGDFRVVTRATALRTQQKNARREAALFAPNPPHHHLTNSIHMRYVTSTINATKSHTITEALFKCAGIGDRFAEADFRLPLDPNWTTEANYRMKQWREGPNKSGKPVMIYRPLVVRPEWMGSKVRNAVPEQYRAIVSHLHQKFFCVSVADLEPQKEWLDGDQIPADLHFHKGEFVIEELAALMRAADLVLTSGGFAAMLGPAVETPTISILGGYEPPSWCADSGKFSPFLCIAPPRPCQCGSSGCQQNCNKRIDVPAALASIDNFTSMIGDTDAEA
jgi:hypothetical protein